MPITANKGANEVNGPPRKRKSQTLNLFVKLLPLFLSYIIFPENTRANVELKRYRVD